MNRRCERWGSELCSEPEHLLCKSVEDILACLSYASAMLRSEKGA